VKREDPFPERNDFSAPSLGVGWSISKY